MKILISSVIFVLTAFILCPTEAAFAQKGSSSQKSEPPTVIRTFKPKQTKTKRNNNRRKSNYPYFAAKRKSDYPYFVARGKSTKRKMSKRKIDLSKVPRVIRVTK